MVVENDRVQVLSDYDARRVVNILLVRVVVVLSRIRLPQHFPQGIFIIQLLTKNVCRAL